MSLMKKQRSRCARFGFTLIELIAIIAIIVILITAGVGLVRGTGPSARKAGTDLLIGMIEQARTAAISSRTNVVLAIAEPGDLPTGDARCRLGMFKIKPEDWPADPTGAELKGELMSRWRVIETGAALIGGEVNGTPNPIDGPELNVIYGGFKPVSVKVHAIAFNSLGRLLYPVGSTPVAMRVAEGIYSSGKATAYQRGDAKTISENRLKIGRVNARPYRID